MSKKKLTLSVEDRLTRRAKAIAKKRGTSVSHLVETFFATLEGDLDVETGAEREAGKEEGRAAGPTGRFGEHEFSAWAHQWRGAFKEPGRSYPNNPAWDEEVIAEEIANKHT